MSQPRSVTNFRDDADATSPLAVSVFRVLGLVQSGKSLSEIEPNLNACSKRHREICGSHCQLLFISRIASVKTFLALAHQPDRNFQSAINTLRLIIDSLEVDQDSLKAKKPIAKRVVAPKTLYRQSAPITTTQLAGPATTNQRFVFAHLLALPVMVKSSAISIAIGIIRNKFPCFPRDCDT